MKAPITARVSASPPWLSQAWPFYTEISDGRNGDAGPRSSLTPPGRRALPAAPSHHLHIGISRPCAPRLAPRCCSDGDLGGVLHVWGLWAETPVCFSTLGSQLASSGPMDVGSRVAGYFGWECRLLGISAQQGGWGCFRFSPLGPT